ncbi:hypothetical protein AQUCO_02600006v1 [Aquilegia coerulea]|uniref:Pentacotripeptide-repeat region of PRORP domain-containing protein n=1 Tax=Aquilegia coerulea TaxID=218851 RepID=A0A2G5D6X8_AQUCA|nr:hypothetical protein AQUCO_02600006v1 [Aquilegia coerulea]
MCKRNKMELAVEYFDEMFDVGWYPDPAVYTCLMIGFGNQKMMDKVYQLLKEMKSVLIKLMTNWQMPDDAPNIRTYNMMMKSYFQVKNHEMGCAEVIEKCMKISRAGRPKFLEELAQKMKFSGKFEASNVFARWSDWMKK